MLMICIVFLFYINFDSASKNTRSRGFSTINFIKHAHLEIKSAPKGAPRITIPILLLFSKQTKRRLWNRICLREH